VAARERARARPRRAAPPGDHVLDGVARRRSRRLRGAEAARPRARGGEVDAHVARAPATRRRLAPAAARARRSATARLSAAEPRDRLTDALRAGAPALRVVRFRALCAVRRLRGRPEQRVHDTRRRLIVRRNLYVAWALSLALHAYVAARLLP